MLSLRAPAVVNKLPIRRLHSSQHAFQPVPTITGPLNTFSVDEFRARAFTPERPLLITAGDGKPRPGNEKGVKAPTCAIPAAEKWFTRKASSTTSEDAGEEDGFVILSQEYLAPFSSTILPYELITPHPSKSGPDTNANADTMSELSTLLKHYTQYSSPSSTFHTFSAPLSLFLLASKCLASSPSSPPPQTPQLYIAQAQLLSLPSPLQHDLPTPHLVSHAGKGDIYDSNLWLGLPPTYTPLHKDPNPNLFVQLAGRKQVRMFEPRVGGGIYRSVQGRIGRGGFGGGGQMRGSEMMEGPERGALWEAVWGDDGMEGRDGGAEEFEALVGPGDALFIPKGWWHSFRSVGGGVTGSVNWWFR
ncbi:hypothetical protein BKA64DRAFT_743933 [Cadophora sp. MPI-SDFR-AT-0126]|nr:hypothetical protein BKA64DRAFT_743933 [Leotiomycetes sp. MPI-SDFR-AT-0126]